MSAEQLMVGTVADCKGSPMAMAARGLVAKTPDIDIIECVNKAFRKQLEAGRGFTQQLLDICKSMLSEGAFTKNELS
jgi:hypothetical protein